MTIQQDVASAIAWLEQTQAQQLLKHLLQENPSGAQAILEHTVPDLAEACDLTDPAWRQAFVDELEFRIAGSDDESDPDDVQTRELPDYTRYARSG